LLVNPEGKVLLQLRSNHDFLYPSCWTLPGGRIEKGETPEVAIAREVNEELGLDLGRFSLFRTIVENMSDDVVERHIYSGEISERAEDLILGEGVALRYFAAEQISKLRIAFDLKPIIADFLKTCGH
jgi:8-oxo-dGTP diphosphatase